eukprot:EC725904.1.p1 GENE.EC725904.1~~EC725904.1.p1  ORF type:complete len:110 (+),score=6.55 EC725904.1:36-332(+)
MSKPKAEERPVPKPTVVVADCSDAIQQAAFELAAKAWKGVDRNDMVIAEQIKKGLDEQFEGGWHCIVGKHFAAYVTNEAEKLLMFRMGPHQVLVFKHG